MDHLLPLWNASISQRRSQSEKEEGEETDQPSALVGSKDDERKLLLIMINNILCMSLDGNVVCPSCSKTE